MSIYTQVIWRWPVVGLYAATALVIGQHLLTCRLKYGTILMPWLAPYIPWYLIAPVAAVGVAFALAAYRDLWKWAVGAAVAAVPILVLASWWIGALDPE